MALLAAPATGHADDRALGADLTVAGSVVLATTYGLTGLTSTTLVIVANTRPETIAESWIPLVGPWIMLGDSAGFNDLQRFAVAASGVVQAAGLGLLVAGLVLSHAPDEDADVALLLGPAGLGLRGRF